MSQAIQEATDNCPLTRGRKFANIVFDSVWVGIAGYERPALTQSLNNAIYELIKTTPGKPPRVTADIDLLSASLSMKQEIDSVIVLVAGTGSIGMSFKRTGSGFQRAARVGGWGHLLGDDGSGYGIGRQALRKALLETDIYRMTHGTTSSPASSLSPLSQAIYEYFHDEQPTSTSHDLLSSIVMPTPGLHQTEDAALGTTKRIAGVAKIVLSMATTDDEAKSIVDSGTASLAELVTLLAKGHGVDTSRCGLVLAGGLMQNELYRGALVDVVKRQVGEFGQIEAVNQPAFDGARLLAKRL